MDWLHAPVLLMVVAMPKDAMNAHPAFKTLPEAVAFISGCLDANDPKTEGVRTTIASFREALAQRERWSGFADEGMALQPCAFWRFFHARRSCMPGCVRGSVPGPKMLCFWIFCVPVVGIWSVNHTQPGALK